MSMINNIRSILKEESNSALTMLLLSTNTDTNQRDADTQDNVSTTSMSTVSYKLRDSSVNGVKIVLERRADKNSSCKTGRKKLFVCEVCNRGFCYKHVLQNHERTHTGEKPFECQLCKKRFTRNHHMKIHMRLHTGEKPYSCQICERQFAQVGNLRRHIRVHTEERPFTCKICNSKFNYLSSLQTHMSIHKGEKQFECKKCQKRYRLRHHLMYHKCPKDEKYIAKQICGRKQKSPNILTVQKTDPLEQTSSLSLTNSALKTAAASSNQFQTENYHRLLSQTSKSATKNLKLSSLVSPLMKSLQQSPQSSIQTQPLNLTVISPSQKKSSIIVPSAGYPLFAQGSYYRNDYQVYHGIVDEVLDLSLARNKNS